MPGEQQESDRWWAAYGADQEVRRRRLAMPAKLRKLGLAPATNNAVSPGPLLDLCCGAGEALDTLHAWGWRDLHGRDLTLPPGLRGDHRFQLTEGDACHCPYPDHTFDWITCIHALHHFASAAKVAEFLAEADRLLKPGGRLGIVDFPNSPQIRLAFWFFRQQTCLWTPYLKRFGALIAEEWPFLKDYLPQWPQVHRLLHDGPFHAESEHHTLFYFHLRLRKTGETDPRSRRDRRL